MIEFDRSGTNSHESAFVNIALL